jgi:hypothetical protein
MLSFILGLLAVLSATVLAVGGMLLVRKRIGVEALSAYHEVAGYLLSIVGTLYAVLLGFVVVDAMAHTQELRVLVDQEASGLCNIYLCANGLPSAEKFRLQTECREYASAVIDDEWPKMQTGGYSPVAFKKVWTIWKDITTYAPETEGEKALHGQLVSEICTMTQNHRTRVVSAKHGVNPLLWAVLIIGAVFTVLFTYFFAVKNLKAQILMTVLVSLTLSLNVLLVFIFGNPFVGEFAIQPDSFKLDQMIFQNFEKGDPPKSL